MERIHIKILSVLILIMSLSSCYKDMTTYADHTIADIEIEGVDSVINAYYGQVIELEAKVKQGDAVGKEFTYLWEMDIVPGSLNNRIELSNTPALKYTVANSLSDRPYIITLTVGDSETGLSKVIACKLYVSSSLGEGLLIAHTRDGGLTSDLDIVSSKAISYGFKENMPRYTRNLYSFANGNPVEGKINSITDVTCSNSSVYNQRKIMIGTDSHLIAIDPLTFKQIGLDKDQFNIAPAGPFNTASTFNFASYVSGAIVNGTMYCITCNSDQYYNKTSFPLEPGNIFEKNNVAYARLDQGKVAVFDENSGRFYYMAGWMAMNGAMSEIENKFDIDLTGAKSMAAGGTKDSALGFIIKDKAGKYHICTIGFPGNANSTVHYDLTGDGLDNMVSAVFCDNADIVYYATPTTVYSVVLSGGVASAYPLTWKPDSQDEKITGLVHYQQAWYGICQYYLGSYEFALPTNRMQILITTYNSKTKEGKIYLKPFNVSTGRFQFKDNGKLTGFGEITAIGSTLK